MNTPEGTIVSIAQPRLTTTSYAILGLLAVKPWTTYELTKQMEWSLGRIWPRATSKLYEEPKKLVEHKLATATESGTGRRPSTVYRITPAGRRALAAWLEEPGAGPVFEHEQLLKVFFADQGSKAATLANLAAARAWAVEQNAGNIAAGEQFEAGTSEFQARGAHTMLVGGFLTEYYRMVAEWADWATKQVQRWPDDPASAEVDMTQLRKLVRRARW